MSRARQFIEGFDPDSPESFGVQAHLTSPVAHLLAKNGFTRRDRHASEERWVKRLKDGNEAWFVTWPEHNEEPLNPRDPQRSGGRQWRMLISDGKEYRSVMDGNELVMSAILGAFLQRLATWPPGLPKPGEPGSEKLFQ